MNKKKIILLVSLVLSLSVLYIFTYKGYSALQIIYGFKLPSDSYLQEHFDENTNSFEKLVLMFSEDDHLLSMSEWGIVSNSGLIKKGDKDYPAPNRLQEYNRLLREAKAFDGIDRDTYKSSRIFIRFSSAVVDDSDIYQTYIDEKGYVFSETEPQPLLSSLDNSKEIDGIAFKKIRDNWYLYYRMSIGKPE